jgi:hypothetical protein
VALGPAWLGTQASSLYHHAADQTFSSVRHAGAHADLPKSLSAASVEISISYSLQIGQNVTNQRSDSRAAHAQKALVPIAEK